MLARVMKKMKPAASVAAGLAVAVALAGGAAGCGSSNSSPDGGGHGGASGANGGNNISWQDDGTAYGTAYGTGSLVTSSGIQILQVAGGTSGGIGIALGVTGMPSVGAGTYTCGPADGGYPITSFSYTATGVEPLFVSCTINVSALGGGRTAGTFAAVLNKSAGGTKAITNGTFDVPLALSP